MAGQRCYPTQRIERLRLPVWFEQARIKRHAGGYRPFKCWLTSVQLERSRHHIAAWRGLPADSKRAIEFGESNGAAVQRNILCKWRQVTVTKTLFDICIQAARGVAQTQRCPRGAQAVVDRLRVSRIDKHAQHAVTHKLHVVRAKQMNGVSSSAIKLLHHIAQLGAGQALRPMPVVLHVSKERCSTGKLFARAHKATIRSLLTQVLTKPRFLHSADMVALDLYRSCYCCINSQCAHHIETRQFIELGINCIPQFLRLKRFGQVIVSTSGHSVTHVAALRQ